MKRVYQEGRRTEKENSSRQELRQEEGQEEEEWEGEEIDDLYEWTQTLSYDDIR